MADMKELVTVTGHERALATIRYHAYHTLSLPGAEGEIERLVSER